VPQFTLLGQTVAGSHGGEPQTEPASPPAPPHVSGAVQVPHDAITPPQPFAHGPQFTPEGQTVMGVHGGVPHWKGVPAPPHVSPDGHDAQVTVPPHPLAMVPHSPAGHEVIGVQGALPHWNGVPPPPHD
jgi:hypothetical protein